MRLALIFTNKWLKAEYASPLRALLAGAVWVEELVDLGHARQVPSLLPRPQRNSGAIP